MKRKVFELNNIVIDETDKLDKYVLETSDKGVQSYELPLGIGKFENVYIGRRDVDSCTEAYSEINNLNRV